MAEYSMLLNIYLSHFTVSVGHGDKGTLHWLGMLDWRLVTNNRF